MNTQLQNISSKLSRLQRQELELQAQIKHQLKSSYGMKKTMGRILDESKLKKIREEIEQEEYNLFEAKILFNLANA